MSGDGGTGSIGVGQFAHVVRRNLNMVYVVMNNGCYGLTKGQDSATADKGSKTKKGSQVSLEAIDLCEMVIQGEAGFVARGFSGDKKQIVGMLKAAFAHSRLAFFDIISPCVSFNNVPTATKSYSWVREHMEATHTFDFIPYCQEITIDYTNGSTAPITLHDGSTLKLCKLRDNADITRKSTVIIEFEKAKEENHILTGILYLDPASKDTHEVMETLTTPLNTMNERELCRKMKCWRTLMTTFVSKFLLGSLTHITPCYMF